MRPAPIPEVLLAVNSMFSCPSLALAGAGFRAPWSCDLLVHYLSSDQLEHLNDINVNI